MRTSWKWPAAVATLTGLFFTGACAPARQGDLPSSGTVQVTIAVTTTVSGGPINTVTVGSATSDPTPGNNTGSASTTVGSGPTLNLKIYAPLISRNR